eukprot:gene32459-61096_t
MRRRSLVRTRDPGFGRPPFTSSRLRLASNAPVQITLSCVNNGSVPCSFGQGTTLRGVGFDGHVTLTSQSLVFTLPPPAAGRSAAHYYLEATVRDAAGPSQFARGDLFYFWIDSSDDRTLRLFDVTTLGVRANSTELQTKNIQRLLDTFTLPPGGRLWFPGPALYRTGELVIRRPG